MALARIIIADRNAPTRQMLIDLLQEHCEIVGIAADGNDVPLLVQSVRPEVILLGLAFEGTTGFQIARKLRQSNSDAKIIIVSPHESQDLVRAALTVGASGYVFMSRVLEDLPAAIDAVRQGKNFESGARNNSVAGE